MNDSSELRISIVATDVVAGKEDEFLALIDELQGLIRQRGYGSDRLLQDASNPRRYYHVRTWNGADAAERCLEDPEVGALWARLDQAMRFSNLVGMARPVEIWGASRVGTGQGGDRRTARERRTPAADRRTLDLRPPRGEQRTGRDRRTGERRTGGDPRTGDDQRSPGAARRGGDRRDVHATPPREEREERRTADRRSALERRSGADRRSVALRDAHTTAAASRETLVAAARAARTRARAPFSTFPVGAALETRDGSIVTGCNVENATYGLTMCAERVAMFKAISEGYRAFTRVAVVADTADPTPPCGACRQILWELGGDLEVVLANLTIQKGRFRLKDLLPLPFDARFLGE